LGQLLLRMSTCVHASSVIIDITGICTPSGLLNEAYLQALMSYE
jgi:hypothetical protein